MDAADPRLEIGDESVYDLIRRQDAYTLNRETIYTKIFTSPNLQRQRESGFTLYAISGIIFYCLFYLIDHVKILINIDNNPEYFNIAVTTSNCLFILLLVLLFYFSNNSDTKATKIFPYKEPLEITLDDFPYFIGLIIISALNFIYIPHAQNRLHYYYLLVFGIISGLNFLSPFIIRFFRYFARKKKIKKGFTIENIDFTRFNNKVNKAFSVSLLGYGILFTVFTAIILFKIHTNLDADEIAETIKYVSMFYGLLALINIVTAIKSNQKDNRDREEFEREIYFNQISSEEIIKRYEQEFAGIPFTKWIADKNREVMTFFNNKKDEFIKTDQKLSSLDSINKSQLPYEYSGRLAQIINEQQSLLNETNDFIQKIGSNLKNLKIFGSLNDQETVQLRQAETLLYNNIMGFNNQYRNRANKIAIRQKSL